MITVMLHMRGRILSCCTGSVFFSERLVVVRWRRRMWRKRITMIPWKWSKEKLAPPRFVFLHQRLLCSARERTDPFHLTTIDGVSDR